MSNIVSNLGGSDDEDFGDVEEKTSKRPSSKVKTKGRGFKGGYDNAEDRSSRTGAFESIDHDGEDAKSSSAQKSVEGWIIFVTNVHEEAQEDDLYDLFSDYGDIKQIHLNLDRRTGYVKGYAAIEFEHFKEAQSAVDSLNGHSLLEQEIIVDFAFVKPKASKRR